MKKGGGTMFETILTAVGMLIDAGILIVKSQDGQN